MNLIRAETKANYLIKELEPFCDQIEVVGNIRRKRQNVDSIDILLAPKGVMLFELMTKLTEMGHGGSLRIADKQTILLKDELEEVKANLWFTSVDKWPVMLFVKTGGIKSVKRIENLCGEREWQLSISKGAIFNGEGKKLLIEKEEDIFSLLGVHYIEPSWRE